MKDETALLKVEPQPATGKLPLPIGLAVFLVVIAGLIYAFFGLENWLKDEQRLPVQEVIISGELTQLNETSLKALVLEHARVSFFALDVNDVHGLIEDQNWVYRASIRKRWPSKLYIHIIEQDAVARWNDDLLLNRYGDVFDGGGNQLLLPSLYGPGGSEKTVLTGLSQMQKLLSVLRVRIKEVFLSERFAWQVTLENGIVLKLGRREYIDRLQRFIDVYPLILQQNKPVRYIDLRYDTGLAVGWAENNNKATVN